MKYAPLVVLLVFLLSLYSLAESYRRKIVSDAGLVGMASWYVPKTGAGDLVCAMRNTNFGKLYRVCNQANGKCVVVRHAEWGPDWISLRQARIIDLSRQAFSRIAEPTQGLIKVTVREEKDSQ